MHLGNIVLDNDSCTHTGDFLEVAGEIEICSSGSTQLPEIVVSNVVNQRLSVPAITNDHDYLHDPIRCILVAEKMVDQQEEIMGLKKELRRKNQTISKQKTTIRNLRTELRKLKSALSQGNENRLVDPVLIEIQANKMRKRGGARYSDDMKNLALILQYCSKKAYKQMRQFFALPSISTLRNWLGRVNVQEGFSTTILNLLR